MGVSDITINHVAIFKIEVSVVFFYNSYYNARKLAEPSRSNSQVPISHTLPFFSCAFHLVGILLSRRIHIISFPRGRDISHISHLHRSYNLALRWSSFAFKSYQRIYGATTKKHSKWGHRSSVSSSLASLTDTNVERLSKSSHRRSHKLS